MTCGHSVPPFYCIITVMFVCIKHGDGEEFLVNTECNVICLLQYLRSKLGLSESEVVDLCDETGALIFISRQEYASQVLTPYNTYIVCTINRNSAEAYVSITPHVANPDPALQGVSAAASAARSSYEYQPNGGCENHSKMLQKETISLEQARRKKGYKSQFQKQSVRPPNPANR